MGVSILVFVELALDAYRAISARPEFLVSILVFVELALDAQILHPPGIRSHKVAILVCVELALDGYLETLEALQKE